MEKKFSKVHFLDRSGFSKLEGSRLLITGASGWLGLEMLCLLDQIYPGLKNISLTLAGSKKRIIQIHGRQLEVIPLNEIPKSASFDYIFHFAFATQDKVRNLGISEYTLRNKELNVFITELALRNPQSRNLILSSGAVSKYPDFNYITSPMEIYANLKRDLEFRFNNPYSLVLRLWNSSGHHMGYTPKYALSEFVNSAKASQDILVGKNIGRSYVSADAVLRASVAFLLSGGHGIVNSGGENIRLFELAQLVVSTLGSNSKVELADAGDFTEFDYFSPQTEIPAIYWDSNPNLISQIINTANYV